MADLTAPELGSYEIGFSLPPKGTGNRTFCEAVWIDAPTGFAKGREFPVAKKMGIDLATGRAIELKINCVLRNWENLNDQRSGIAKACSG